MKNIMHIVHNISEEDLMDIVDEVFENVNFETIMDNDENHQHYWGTMTIIVTIREDQSEDTKS